MKLSFLGANRQVTGSCYHLEAGGKSLLIDCGMFQERRFQSRNWDAPPVDLNRVDALLLTHAHLDHSGRIPRLVKAGFNRPVYTTAPSIDLARLVLLDAARIQEEDVAFKRQRHQREGRRSPHPYEPLYEVGDAERALTLFHPVTYGQPLKLGEHVSVVYHDAGHILGSAMLEVTVRERGEERRLVFSGDLGLWNKPLVRDPSLLERADYLVMESTYGDHDHDHEQGLVEDQLARIINATAEAGGNIVIPTFAIERAQELLYHLGRLQREDRIPHLMTFLDSPMGVDATAVFQRHADVLDADYRQMVTQGQPPFRFDGLVLARTREQSKAINHIRGSCIIMAGSGMCTGGRIKHHLAHNLSRPESTVVFVGYQSAGTLGRSISEGEPTVRILGQDVAVRARVAHVTGMSAHADRSALLRWTGHFRQPPTRTFLTHGEERVSLDLAKRLGESMGWDVAVPEYGDVVELR